MKIRKITRYSKRGYDALLRLIPQLNPDSPLTTRQDFEEILKSGNSHFFIAELDNRDIAGIITLITYIIPTGRKFWIEDVVVDESQRGKGIGKKMIMHALAYAESLGAKSVDLTSRPFRKAANQLYLDMGFELRETNAYRYYVN